MPCSALLAGQKPFPAGCSPAWKRPALRALGSGLSSEESGSARSSARAGWGQPRSLAPPGSRSSLAGHGLTLVRGRLREGRGGRGRLRRDGGRQLAQVLGRALRAG